MLDSSNESKPGLEERYISATMASDLTVDAHRIGAVDHLIAAGLVGNRMGAALGRLLAEWGRIAKPPKRTESDIAARAQELPDKKGRADMKRARAEATVSYARDMRAAYLRIPGRADALAIMLEWAQLRSVDPDLLSPALYHWLSPTCLVCDGLGHLRMPDAPVLGKQCHHCHGSGSWPRPQGAHRVAEWLTSCAGKAKSQRAGLLHGNHEITPMAERMKKPAQQDESAEDAERIAAVFRESMGRKRARKRS